MLGESLSPHHGSSSDCRWSNGLQPWRIAANILKSSRGQMTRGGPPAWRSGVELITLHCKTKFITTISIEPLAWTDSLDKRPKRRNMDMRFGFWNVRSLYRAGSLMTVLREL
jgi:hypothetical protein